MNEVSAPGLGWFYKMVCKCYQTLFWHNFNVEMDGK